MAITEGHTFTAGEIVTPTKLNSLVSALTIGSGHITSGMIAADAIDGTKIADDSIDSEHYVADSIDNEHLADDSVDSDQIADNAVGADQLAGGFGIKKYDSGWVQTDGSTTLANGATMTFTHNLGSSAVNVAIWASEDNAGTNAHQINFNDEGADTNTQGAIVTDVSSTTVEIQCSSEGCTTVTSTGVNDHPDIDTWGASGICNYIRIIVIG